MIKWLVVLGAALALCSGVAARAQAPKTQSDAPVDAQQQLREALQLLLSRLAVAGALGQHPEQLALNVDAAAQRVNDLGLLVDSSSAERARDGLRALAATPGGGADRMGLRPGDVIVAVNGTSLRALGADGQGRALAAWKLKAAVDALSDGAALHLEVERDGSKVDLQTTLRSVVLPAVHLELHGSSAAVPSAATAATGEAKTGCGRISTFEAAPLAKQLYPARVLSIDGAPPASASQEIFKLDGGKHVLLLAENIPNEEIGVGEFAQMRRSGSKALTIDVKPATTLMIAAELKHEKAADPASNSYWQPVVWNEVAETCP